MVPPKLNCCKTLRYPVPMCGVRLGRISQRGRAFLLRGNHVPAKRPTSTKTCAGTLHVCMYRSRSSSAKYCFTMNSDKKSNAPAVKKACYSNAVVKTKSRRKAPSEKIEPATHNTTKRYKATIAMQSPVATPEPAVLIRRHGRRMKRVPNVAYGFSPNLNHRKYYQNLGDVSPFL